ncbi:carboxylesterase/lipase family protein [Butyrivibrio sp. VCD2006]|uniref:carboxylesterase/lipase family protein n=1 Tax=Butyrivibrio sp. VCD2006 TaxID=1280664 RepID=UPI0003F6C7AD|nr:carboxylesterase family protein [Butyrivibrio sp. VCD2006]
MRTIKTKYGMIKGVDCGSYMVYRGIPYAKAPVGDLRWKAPQEPDVYTGVFHADRFSDIAPQRIQSPDGPQMGFNYGKEFYADKEFLRNMSEDCLYLNIWTPADVMPDAKLPVAFYIHGGAFMGGYSSEEEFDGESYARKGVILVTIAYRLGALGFLAHPWLSEENHDSISGNYGILDQIAALKWVYENIPSFGGNPENITVFGQSAGCMSTQVLISSALTGEMINKAILQSGVTCESDFLLTPSLDEEMAYGEKFVQLTGASSLKELRDIPFEKLLEYQDMFISECFQSGIGLALVPCIDGHILKKSVRDIYQNGQMRKIPYMTGFVANDIGQTQEDKENKKAGLLEDECKRWCLKTQEMTGIPSYLYSFVHDLPGDDSGAFHSAELWYMFGTLGRCWRPMNNEDVKLSEKMVTYWTNFMKNGRPSDEAAWRPYIREDEYIEVFC